MRPIFSAIRYSFERTRVWAPFRTRLPFFLFSFLTGSDVQRRIADAMAGMLKAGGRAMTGTDATSSGGAIGVGADHPNQHSASGDGYRAVDGQESPRR